MCVHINCLKEFGMLINKKLVLLFMFLTAVGICTGGFFEVFMNGEGKQQLIEIMSSFFSAENSQGTFAAFLNSFKTWLILLCLLFFSPVFPPLALLCPVIPLIKGLTMGFSATMLIEAFSVKGTWYIATTMLPQNIIQIPVMCFLAALSFEGAYITSKAFFSRKRRSLNKKALQNYARQYLIIYCAGIILIIASCILEAFLS